VLHRKFRRVALNKWGGKVMIRLKTSVTLAASVLALAGCENTAPTQNDRQSAQASTTNAPSVRDKIAQASSGHSLTVEEILASADRLEKDEFSTTANHTREVGAVDADMTGKGSVFTVTSLDPARMNYDADSGKVTYTQGAMISMDAVAQLGRAASRKAAYGEGSIGLNDLEAVNEAGFVKLYDQQEDGFLGSGGVKTLFLRDDGCPIRFSASGEVARSLKFDGAYASVSYHIPIFSRAVLSEFNKVANVAWESGIWNDLVLDVEMDEISIFDKDGVLVAKIQC